MIVQNLPAARASRSGKTDNDKDCFHIFFQDHMFNLIKTMISTTVVFEGVQYLSNNDFFLREKHSQITRDKRNKTYQSK